MRKNLYILFLTLWTLAFAGCSKSEEITVPEGQPATVTFSLANPDPEIVETKGMTSSEEKNISRVFIMIFDSDNRMVASQEFTDVRTEMVMPAYSGTGMQFYAITNYTTSANAAGNPGLKSMLSAVHTLSDLENIICDGTGMSATNPGLMTMLGNTTMNINANNKNTVTINLHYLSAKITVKFVDATSDQKVRFFGWEAHNLPLRGYLIEHASDAVNPLDASDFYHIEGNNAWEKEEVTGSHHTVSESFYMFENRRGVSSAPFTNGYKDKTDNALAGASYLKASLSCVNQGITYNIKTKVYLGANNTDDYNIERSKHYTYTITIKGVNSITVDVETDSNTEAAIIPLDITTSSTLVFDAHPDQRIIRLGADADKVQNVSIEVLNQTSWLKISPLSMMAHQVRQSGDAGRWQQGGNPGAYVRPKYIPHHSVRQALGGSYTPPDGVTLTADGVGDGVSNLVLHDNDDELPFAQATYRMCYKITDIPFNAEGTALYEFSLYSDEYEYIDGLTARDAIIRISYDDVDDNNVRKSVDLQVFQRQPMDFGEVVTSYYNGSIAYAHAVIEQIEESAIMIDPKLYTVSSALQENRQMKWSYKGKRLFSGPSSLSPMDRYRNGYFLTANAVYGDENNTWTATSGFVSRNTDGSGVQWNTLEDSYRPKEGSSWWSSTIVESASYQNSGSPYYIPTPSATATNNKNYQPIYNSSAARYCHEKNRDIDGDGRLSASETKWYLPSQHELYQLWISQEAVKFSTTEFGTGYYWSSTERDADRMSVIGFMTGYTDNRDKTTVQKNAPTNDVVRCIRRTNVSTTPMVLSNRIIDCSPLPADAKTDISKGSAASGMLDDAGVSLIASSVFTKFQVAKVNALKNGPATAGTDGATLSWCSAIGYKDGNNSYSGDYPADSKLGTPGGTFNKVTPTNIFMKGAPANAVTGCAAYWEGSADDSETGVGKWRLPNKRELLLMWIYREQLEGQDGFTSFNPNNKSDVEFWSASERIMTNAHYVSLETGESQHYSKTKTIRVRCIREIVE